VADVPRVKVRPPIRCCQRRPGTSVVYCGQDARFLRFTSGAPLPTFFCGHHSRPTDEPIPDDAIFRLVSVTLEIHLCAVSQAPGMAHAEALNTLERVIESAGGVINLHACRSLLARGELQPPIGAQRPGRPRGQ
jgi:hypothetical protein